MSSVPEPPTTAVQAATATRFDRDGDTVYNLALRVTASPGAAWHAAVAAFAAVAERVPPDAPQGTDEQDLLLMGCWHARQMLGQLEANPEYAAQLKAHDEANVPMASLQASVVRGNEQLPVDQREILALRGLSRLDHQDLAALLRAEPGVLAAMLAQARLMLRDAMRGGSVAQEAAATPESRQAVALAALRQDGQLRGAEARLVLARWLEGDASRRTVVDALEEAGLSYRAWSRTPVPDGLRETVLAAAGAVQAPPPAAVAEPAPVAAAEPAATPAPAAQAPVAPAAPTPAAPEPEAPVEDPNATQVHAIPDPVAASGPATPVAPTPARPTPPADPDATVEWSTSDIQALGLDGEGEEPGEDWAEDDWDESGDAEAHAPDEDGYREPARYPRWQIAVVAVFLIAIILVLVFAFLPKDDPTPAKSGAVPSPALVAAAGTAVAAAPAHGPVVVRVTAG